MSHSSSCICPIFLFLFHHISSRSPDLWALHGRKQEVYKIWSMDVNRKLGVLVGEIFQMLQKQYLTLSLLVNLCTQGVISTEGENVLIIKES